MSSLSRRLSKVPEKIFSKALAKARKSAVPLHPASIGGGNAGQAEKKKVKFFSKKLDKLKSLRTFALPNRKKGKQSEERRRPRGRSATSIGSRTRSLNDWKRQMVRFVFAQAKQTDNRRNIELNSLIRVGFALDISPGSPGCRNIIQWRV